MRENKTQTGMFDITIPVCLCSFVRKIYIKLTHCLNKFKIVYELTLLRMCNEEERRLSIRGLANSVKEAPTARYVDVMHGDTG